MCSGIEVVASLLPLQRLLFGLDIKRFTGGFHQTDRQKKIHHVCNCLVLDYEKDNAGPQFWLTKSPPEADLKYQNSCSVQNAYYYITVSHLFIEFNITMQMASCCR